MQETGIIVYGRKTYELMVPFWPNVTLERIGPPGDVAFADAMVSIPKIVVSSTLKNVDGNTRIVRESPEALIKELKQESGKKLR